MARRSRQDNKQLLTFVEVDMKCDLTVNFIVTDATNLRSLISAFVVYCPDNMMPMVAIFEIPRLLLAFYMSRPSLILA